MSEIALAGGLAAELALGALQVAPRALPGGATGAVVGALPERIASVDAVGEAVGLQPLGGTLPRSPGAGHGGPGPERVFEVWPGRLQRVVNVLAGARVELAAQRGPVLEHLAVLGLPRATLRGAGSEVALASRELAHLVRGVDFSSVLW